MKSSLKNNFSSSFNRRYEKAKSFFVSAVEVVFFSTRGFIKDKCSLRATSLTYYTLLSVVPLLAISFALAKAVGLYETLEKELFERWAEYKEGVDQIVDFANNLLENTQGGLIAGVGFLFFLISIMKLLSRMEESFYVIWQVQKPRAWKQRSSVLLSLLLVLPIFFLASSSMKVWIFRKLAHFLEGSHFAFLLSFSIKQVPFLFVWGFLTFLYLFLPKYRVKLSAALFGAIIAGTIFELVGWGYIYFQVGVSRYGAIYGSFAALPLFLIYVQLIWMVILFGGEMSFTFQHRKTAKYEKKNCFLSFEYTKLLSLWLTKLSIDRFLEEKEPITWKEMEEKFHIPITVAREVMGKLVTSGILIPIESRKEKEVGFGLNRPVDTLHIFDVLDAIDAVGKSKLPIKTNKSFSHLKDFLEGFSDKIHKLKENRLVKDID